MKSYWSIPGLKEGLKSFENLPCTAFYKLDGSCLRFEWSHKRGWYKFGTRARLFDKTDQEYGRAIDLFQNKYADGIEKVFKSNYSKIEGAIVFCEFFGPSSFAGWHNFKEEFEVCLFDVDIHKRGFVLPEEFIQNFGHLGVPPVIYQGPFDKEFCSKVIQNGLDHELDEGVVVKGVLPGKKQHGLWMSKIKTKAWLNKLKEKASQFNFFQKILEENNQEQK